MKYLLSERWPFSLAEDQCNIKNHAASRTKNRVRVPFPTQKTYSDPVFYARWYKPGSSKIQRENGVRARFQELTPRNAL